MSRTLIDLSGRRFGRLTVIEQSGAVYYGPDKQHRPIWRCRCDCGNEVIVTGNNLRSGNTKSCGCLNPRHLIDLTGRRFGRLTVIERAENQDNKVMWRCRCDCGNETIALSQNLRNGMTRSCGCLRKELARESIKAIAVYRKRRCEQ